MEMSHSDTHLFELVRTDNIQQLKTIDSTKLNICNDNGATLIHAAVASQSLQCLQFLLNNSTISVNTQDRNGDTALHIAMRTAGPPQTMSLLLEGGADDSLCNNLHEPPLTLLLQRDNATNLLAAFLKHPVHLNVAGEHGYTPLHTMAYLDKTEALEMIWPVITREASELFPRDAHGKTPLHTAASRGSHRTLDFMITQSGTNVLYLLDDGWNTPLHTAVEYNRIASVEVLLKHGASPTILRGDKLPPCHMACQQDKMDIVVAMVEHCGPEIMSSRDAAGATPLHCCSKSVCDQLFSFVIDNGANIDSQDNSGNTPLHNAVTHGSVWRVEALLGKGADPSICNESGYNPFHLSLQYSRGEIFKALIKSEHAHTLCTSPDARGDFPVHLAVRSKFTLPVPILMSMMTNSDPSSYKDAQGNNVLHAAAESGDTNSLSHILSLPCYKYLLNGLNSGGMTPLHMAACNGSVAPLQELIDHGAIMQYRSSHGDTPFMLACLNGHLKAATVLYNASPSSRDSVLNNDGENALHLAARSKNTDVMTMCLDKGITVTLNKSGESFFDTVLKEQDTDSVVAILQHARWEECLDGCSSHLPHPILRIIEDVPEAFQVVLDRSASHSLLSRQHHDWWEEYHFKYLTLSSTPPPQDDTTNTVTMPTSQGVSRRDSFAVLIHLIKYRHQSYLRHPVIATYLSCKWRRYARPYYIFRFLLFFLFTLLLSVFIGITPAPLQTPLLTNLTMNNPSEGFGVPSNVLRFLTIALALLNLLVWVIDVYVLGLDALKHVISESDVWIHGLTLLLTLIFTIPWEGLDTLYWEVGAFAVFLAWIAVTLNLQLFTFVGTFVSMLLTVTRNVFGVLLMTSLIVCSFAFPLYILLATVPDFTYTNIGTSIFSVLASLHGELDYRNFSLLTLMGQLRFSVLVFLFLTLATVIMPIVVINLLIGLAVGDIARIQEEAILSQRTIEVRALQALDKRLPLPILKMLLLESHMHFPNRNFVHKLTRIARNMWSDFDDPLNNEQTVAVREKTSVPKEYHTRLLVLEENVATVMVQQKHQQETLSRIEEMLKKVLNKQSNT
ncbi:transient receptor potential cation channel subfamily A member 1-like [Halichondria panicea]|uniref:transient receptor potential cation channel subfamily A member 1-like n=1 Tax=Halichondria panicea TaxID=6063 RepID=UPI00312BBA69